MDVPPFATPALCHASAILASLITKPIVPPLRDVAGLPSMGFANHETAAIVRVSHARPRILNAGLRTHGGKEGIVELLRPDNA